MLLLHCSSSSGHRPYLPPEVPLPPWEQSLLCQAQKPTASLHCLSLCRGCHLSGIRHDTATYSRSVKQQPLERDHLYSHYSNDSFSRFTTSWIRTTTSSGQKWWSFSPGVVQRWASWLSTHTGCWCGPFYITEHRKVAAEEALCLNWFWQEWSHYVIRLHNFVSQSVIQSI